MLSGARLSQAMPGRRFERALPGDMCRGMHPAALTIMLFFYIRKCIANYSTSLLPVTCAGPGAHRGIAVLQARR